MGGAPYHKKGRPVFFQNVNGELCMSSVFPLTLVVCDMTGLILVHDLTNRKTHSHLTKWLSEFHNGSRTGKGVGSGSRASISHSDSFRYC